MTAIANHTPIRGVRIPDGLWDAAKAKAATEGLTVSEVIRDLLNDWVSR